MVFSRRQKELPRHFSQGAEMQREVLTRLLSAARDTEYGHEHIFAATKDYEAFCKHTPIATYDDLKHDIDRMRHGERDILWPGGVKWYAKSSGTTNDKSKFIPVSREGLRDIQYKGSADCVTYYLQNNPKSRLFDGKCLILGGSHAPNYNLPGSLVGDLSAILIENMTPLVELIRVPKRKIALMSDFEAKRELIAQTTLTKDVSNLSGVPSWMLSVLSRVMELSGKQHLEEVWPNLEVFFHGGVAFTPYREQYRQLISKPDMNYMETYNASEGFFGVQNDPHDPSMMLMLDYGIFYEFMPMEEMGKESPEVVPIWGVEKGRNYAVIISTCCGLWRYMLGDTVSFTQTNPYKFIITGRTKHFINAFGEELIVDNAEKALAEACQRTGLQVKDYTAAPVFMDDKARCRHQWLIEFVERGTTVGSPYSTGDDSSLIKDFAHLLDQSLQQINSDYEAKRSGDVTLQELEIIVARPGLFDQWMALRGKLGGQHKVPRLSNNRDIIDQLINLNNR